MNDYKFSVLLSVYKAENPTFLQECLDSIFSNSLKPNEVVIVEDGQLTVQLYSVLDFYSSKYEDKIKRVPLKHNVGLGRALASGLTKCSHNLVARMDTDDICVNNRFEIEIEEFIKDRELVLVGTYIDEFYDNPQEIKFTRKVPLKHNEIVVFAKKRNPFNHVTVMFMKDKILEVGNYKKVFDIGYEDYDLWIRLLNAGYKVKNIDVSTVKVRTGKAMLKRRGSIKRLRTALYFRKQLKNIGYISFTEWIIYSLSTIIFTVAPVSMKGFIYKNILRK